MYGAFQIYDSSFLDCYPVLTANVFPTFYKASSSELGVQGSFKLQE